jgi:hypothetical protein
VVAVAVAVAQRTAHPAGDTNPDAVGGRGRRAVRAGVGPAVTGVASALNTPETGYGPPAGPAVRSPRAGSGPLQYGGGSRGAANDATEQRAAMACECRRPDVGRVRGSASTVIPNHPPGEGSWARWCSTC